LALQKAADFQKQAQWKQALAILDQAARQAGAGVQDALSQRLAEARADLTLVARLDAAQLRAGTLVDGQQDTAGAARAYAAAFADAGLGKEGDAIEPVGQGIRASRMRRHLIAALDDWAMQTPDGPGRDWILAVARQADPQPWGDRLRNPKVWR